MIVLTSLLVWQKVEVLDELKFVVLFIRML